MLLNFDHYLLDMASLHPTRHSKLSNSDSIPNHEKVRYSVTNPLFSAENIFLFSYIVVLITAFTYDLCSSKTFKCSHPTITFVVNTTYPSVFGAGLTALYANFVPPEWLPDGGSRECIFVMCSLLLMLLAHATFGMRLREMVC